MASVSRCLCVAMFQNQLRLAYEVVCGEHGTVDTHYSRPIRDLVDKLLNKVTHKHTSNSWLVCLCIRIFEMMGMEFRFMVGARD